MRNLRRWWAAGIAVWLVAGGLWAKDAPAGKYVMYVGTYTDKGSRGIYGYEYDAATGALKALGLEAMAENPSFVAADPTGHYLYAVNELEKYQGKASGGVSAYAMDRKTGKLAFLNEVASRGTDPCYLAFDRTGKYALAANYTSGSVAAFPVLKDGRVGEASAFVQHVGSSVNKERQEGPHAHWIETTADNKFAVAADLGLDELLVYRFDGQDGTLKANEPAFVKLEPGAGPRHVAFSPDEKYAFLINEMGSSVTSLEFDARRGVLKPLGTVGILPKDFTGHNDAAEIHLSRDGKFVYASNRGHDSIVVLAVNQKTGGLREVQDVPTQGKTPRNFVIDPTGKRLLVANQDSGTVVEFGIDEQTGKLTATGQVVEVSQPVCLEFVRMD